MIVPATKLWFGDNRLILQRHVADASVDLVYLDPPFNSGRDYFFREQFVFSDKWPSHEAYHDAVLVCLTECYRVLRTTGSIFLHCDPSASHHLRGILDKVFGCSAYVNEIIWHYYNKMQGNVRHFPENHDTIFWYAKTQQFCFHVQREDREQPQKQLKRVWDKAQGKLVNYKDEQGHCVYTETTDRRVDDVWRLPMLQPANHERIGYPTQKPKALLHRIIQTASSEGDTVLDPYCGSGTTLEVARDLGRNSVGIDNSCTAIEITEERLNIKREQQDAA